MKAKHFFRNLAIQKKLLLITLTICAAVLLLAVSALFVFQVLNFRANFKLDTSTLASIIANNSKAALMFDDRKAANETLASLKVKPTVECACLVNTKGETVAHFGQEDDENELKSFPPPGEFAFDGGALLYTEAIALDDKRIGTLFLRSDYQGGFSQLVRFYAFIIVVVIAVGALLAFWLSEKLGRLITSPLYSLAETARWVGEKNDYSVRSAVDGRRDEIGVLGTAFNHMLERIQNQDAALNLSQQKLGSLVNSIDGVVWEWDAVTSEFTFVSEQSRKILGYPPEAWLGNPNFWNQVVHPDDIETATKHCMEAIAKCEPYHYEYRMIAADKRVVWINEDGMVLTQDGKAVAFRGIFQDITQRKLAEAELTRTSTMLNVLMQNSKDPIYFKDRQSRFVSVSASFLPLFNVSSMEEILGRTDFDFFTKEHSQPAFDDEQEIIRSGQPMLDKLEIETLLDGRSNWVLTSKHPWRDAADNIIGTFGISKDITLLKKAEKQLNETHARLVETSRQAGMAEVATGVLHNVGNVLNSVNVSTTLLNDELEKSKISHLQQATGLMREHRSELPTYLAGDAKGRLLPEFIIKVAEAMDGEHSRWREELKGLKKNVEHMKEIVAMQQSYAKVSGVFEALNASELVEDALAVNLAGLQRHKVQVLRDFSPVPRIMVDKHKVMQILINLVSNAKYALDKNPIQEKKLTVHISPAAANRVKIVVQDNGIGISAENLTRIFGHGFTTKDDGHGFGLHSGALAAKELGGALTASSEGPGRGAIFTLELPVAKNNN